MSQKSNSKALVGKLLLMTLAMFGFGYLLVPIYDVFCEITGLGGRTGGQVTAAQLEPDLDRLVTIEFIASVNQGAPWEFRPTVSRMQVHPGQMYQTSFYARNTSNDYLIGQAVPSVAPGQMARYLQKTECFCFTAQDFLAGESKDMPVIFFLDPEIPEHIDTVTLSYTFFLQDQVVTADPGSAGTFQ
jgi:cytochrome c oxidase assembly protein subunit 11